MFLWFFFSCQETIFSPEGTMEMGLDIYHSSSNLTKLLTTKTGRTQNKTNSIKTSAPTLKWAQGHGPLMPVGLMWGWSSWEAQSELWNIKELFPKHENVALKRNTVFPEENRIEATRLKWSLVWKFQSKNQLSLVTGSNLEVRGMGEAFLTKEEQLFETTLCFGLTDPWNKEVKRRGNSQARECQHWHTQLGQVNLTVPDTRHKKKLFGGKVFFQEKWATWL